jgi:major membrane immunogen (membrane-anchored lipoprotein)
MTRLKTSTWAIFVMLTMLAVSSCAYSQTTSLKNVCSYRVVYNRLVDANLNPVILSKDIASRILEDSLSCLLGVLEPAEITRVKGAIATLNRNFPAEFDELQRNLVRIQFVLAVANRTGAVKNQKNIAYLIAHYMNIGSLNALVRNSRSAKLFPQAIKSPEGQTYVDKHLMNCFGSKDQFPPVLKEWEIRKEVNANEFFVEEGNYKTNFRAHRIKGWGFCVALLRSGGNTGIICSTQDRKKACFFDSYRYQANDGELKSLDWDEMQVTPFQDLAHPSDLLSDQCDSCHKGQNAFFVNPLTQLGKEVMDLYTVPKVRERDEVEKGGSSRYNFSFADFGFGKTWDNPCALPYTSTADHETGRCMACHDLPNYYYHSSYANLLRRSIQEAMPPGKTPFGIHATSKDHPEYNRSVEYLDSAYSEQKGCLSKDLANRQQK